MNLRIAEHLKKPLDNCRQYTVNVADEVHEAIGTVLGEIKTRTDWEIKDDLVVVGKEGEARLLLGISTQRDPISMKKKGAAGGLLVSEVVQNPIKAAKDFIASVEDVFQNPGKYESVG
jgi:hypothetical protein